MAACHPMGVTARRDEWLHLTPLRGRKIVPILERSLSSTALPIYERGAGEAQAVSPPVPISRVTLYLTKVANS
jgi:hypothetical protein